MGQHRGYKDALHFSAKSTVTTNFNNANMMLALAPSLLLVGLMLICTQVHGKL